MIPKMSSLDILGIHQHTTHHPSERQNGSGARSGPQWQHRVVADGPRAEWRLGLGSERLVVKAGDS